MDNLIIDTDDVCNLIVKETMSYKNKIEIKEAYLYAKNPKKVGPPTLVKKTKCEKSNLKIEKCAEKDIKIKKCPKNKIKNKKAGQHPIDNKFKNQLCTSFTIIVLLMLENVKPQSQSHLPKGNNNNHWQTSTIQQFLPNLIPCHQQHPGQP